MRIHLIDQQVNMLKLIHTKHRGQKYGKYPYTSHCYMVKDKALELFGESLICEDDKLLLSICCLGHDLIEDTDETKENLLKKGFDPLIVDTIVTVTKKDGQGYNDYLEGCTIHWLPFYVKLADTYCNLTESLRIDDTKRVRKYATQIDKLHKKRSRYV